MENTHTFSESRLLSFGIFQGRQQNRQEQRHTVRSGRENQEESERNSSPKKRDVYRKGNLLEEYAKGTRQRMDATIKKLHDQIKAKIDPAQQAKRNEYLAKANAVIKQFENNERSDRIVLEKAIGDVERYIGALEDRVYGTGKNEELRFATRTKEIIEAKVLSDGLTGQADKRRAGVYFMDMPRTWEVSGVEPTTITPDGSPDMTNMTQHDISGERKRIYFKSDGNSAIQVDIPGKGPFTFPVSKDGEGNLKFNVDPLRQYDIEAKEEAARLEGVQQEALRNLDDAANKTMEKKIDLDTQATGFEGGPRRQQSSETAKEVFMSMHDELDALDEARKVGAIPEAEYQEKKQSLIERMDKGAQTIVRLMVEESVRMNREGNPKLGEHTQEIQDLFKEVFGTGPAARQRFEAHPLNKAQLIRTDLPSILKIDDNGKLTFVKNENQRDRNTGERVEARDSRYNQRLAYIKLASVLRGDNTDLKTRADAMVKVQKISEEAALGQVLLQELTPKNDDDIQRIGEKYKVYLSDKGDLMEYNDRRVMGIDVGTDETLVPGFSLLLAQSPLAALDKLRTITSAETDYGKKFPEKAAKALDEYGKEKRLMPDEVDKMLAKLKPDMEQFRAALLSGVVAPETLKTMLAGVNKNLEGTFEYSMQIQNLLNANKLTDPVIVPGGKSHFFNYDLNKHVINVTNIE